MAECIVACTNDEKNIFRLRKFFKVAQMPLHFPSLQGQHPKVVQITKVFKFKLLKWHMKFLAASNIIDVELHLTGTSSHPCLFGRSPYKFYALFELSKPLGR